MNLARTLLSLLVATLLASVAFAQNDINSLKERLRARLPEVDALKLASKVGENNQGFLEAREELAEDEAKTVDAENTDRRALYGIIAERANVTIADVGVQRAEQIRKGSATGIWLQAADGTWFKK